MITGRHTSTTIPEPPLHHVYVQIYTSNHNSLREVRLYGPQKLGMKLVSFCTGALFCERCGSHYSYRDSFCGNSLDINTCTLPCHAKPLLCSCNWFVRIGKRGAIKPWVRWISLVVISPCIQSRVVCMLSASLAHITWGNRGTESNVELFTHFVGETLNQKVLTMFGFVCSVHICHQTWPWLLLLL